MGNLRQFELEVWAKERETAGLRTSLDTLMSEIQRLNQLCAERKEAEESLRKNWKKIGEFDARRSELEAIYTTLLKFNMEALLESMGSNGSTGPEAAAAFLTARAGASDSSAIPSICRVSAALQYPAGEKDTRDPNMHNIVWTETSSPTRGIACCSNDGMDNEASHGKKLPSAVVVGTVYCDTCFQEDFSRNSHFISGAHVAVECKDEKSRPSFREEAKTDEHGEFKVHLPFSVSKYVEKIKRCSVELLSSSEPYCAVASTATSSSLRLKSRKEGTHIFSAGFFTFKPEKQPFICNKKPSTGTSREFSSKKAFLPPVDNPTLPPLPQLPPLPLVPGLPPLPLPPLPLVPGLPPLPLPPLPLVPGLPPLPLPPLPLVPGLPPLPQLPPLPPIPADTEKTKTTESLKTTTLPDQKAVHHTNQFGFPTPPLFPPIIQPPPLFPPIIQPPPLFPPILPPNPLQPSPKPFLPLPPIPGLTPPPPPPFSLIPPLPPLPLPPLPPLPLPPLPPLPLPPLIPGIPPASSSSQKKSP